MGHADGERHGAGWSGSQPMRFCSALEEAFELIESATSRPQDWGKPALKRQVDLALQVIAEHVRDFSAISRPSAAISFMVATPRPGSTAGMSNSAAGELRAAVAATESSDFAKSHGCEWKQIRHPDVPL